MVDASVAIKWAVLEDGHEAAVALIAAGHDLLVSDFLTIEVGNVLWKKVRRKEITREQAIAAASEVRQAFSELVPAIELADRALHLAVEIDHPIYDCIYLAAAEEYASILITADTRSISALSGGPYAHLAQPLGA